MQLNLILHPTDFSESASHALRLAVHLATSHEARLLIFHATTLHGEHLDAASGTLETYTQTARDLMEQDLPGFASRIAVSEGRAVLPFDGIMEATNEHKPDLIVIGTHGHSRFSRLLMGSTAEKVLRHAPCSVLTVRAGTPIPADGRFRKVLVPVDFSESAGRGLDGARAIRSDDDSTLYLVHVIDPAPPMYLAGNVSSYFELDPGLRNRIEANLRTWSGDIPGSKIVIAEGNPALEVVRLSEELLTAAGTPTQSRSG